MRSSHCRTHLAIVLCTSINNLHTESRLEMLILLWLSLSSLAAALTLPSSNHTTSNSLSNQPPSANLSWPFILPYTWKDRDSGMFYAYGFSMFRVSLDRSSLPIPTSMLQINICNRTRHRPTARARPRSCKRRRHAARRTSFISQRERRAALQCQFRGPGDPDRERGEVALLLVSVVECFGELGDYFDWGAEVL